MDSYKGFMLDHPTLESGPTEKHGWSTCTKFILYKDQADRGRTRHSRGWLVHQFPNDFLTLY